MSVEQEIKEINPPKKIAGLIETFISTLSANPSMTDTDIERLWSDAWEAFASRAPSTRASYTSYFRTTIREKLGRQHPALAIVRVFDTTEHREKITQSKPNSGRLPRRKESIDNFTQSIAALWRARASSISDGAREKDADDAFGKAVSSLWEEELFDLKRTLTLSSLINTTSQYRSALKNARLDDDLIFSIVRAPQEASDARRQHYLDRVVDRNNALVPFATWYELLDHVETFLPEPNASWRGIEEEAKAYGKGLSRADVTYIGAALLLVTGRRSFEIFCQGSFEPAPIELDYGFIENDSHVTLSKAYHNWHLIFSGQAKTRGRANTRFDESYIIPVLAPAKTIYFSHLALRNSEDGQLWKEMTGSEFRSDMNVVNTERCLLPTIKEEMYSKYWPLPSDEAPASEIDACKPSSHNIRSIYAEIADVNFRRKNMSKVAFTSKILGHGKDDLNTANSYMKYNLPDIKPQALGRRVKSRLVQNIIRETAIRLGISPSPKPDEN